MKKYILILLLAVFTFSCETAPKEVELGPAPGYFHTYSIKFLNITVKMEANQEFLHLDQVRGKN